MHFEAHKTKVYPWIKVIAGTEGDDTAQETIEMDEANSPVMRPWLGNLIVTYAVDMGNQFELLQNRHLPSGMTLEELEQLALENLARDVQYQFAETAFGGRGLLAGGDHETGALCWPGIWEWCANQLEDSLVVAVPAKDILMMVAANDTAKIKALRDFGTQIFATGNRLLTRQLFHYDRATQTWTLFPL